MGIGPADFWTLTPFELRTRALGWLEQQRLETDRALSAAWHAAFWQRVEAKRFPRLREVLSGGRGSEGGSGSRQPQTPEQEASAVRAFFTMMAPRKPKPGQRGAKDGAANRSSSD